MKQAWNAMVYAALSSILVAQQTLPTKSSDRSGLTGGTTHPPCWSSPPAKDELTPPIKSAARAALTQVTISRGTKITLKTMERIASDTTTKGSSVRFVVAHDVTVDGVVVLRAGTPVIGMVTEAKQGIPYRQWPDLEVRIKNVEIGGVKVRLTHSDPNRHVPPPTFNDVATCALLLPLCIASMLDVTEDGPVKPDARSGIQGEVTPCEVWYFRVKSRVKVPTKSLANINANASLLPAISCPQVLENPSCDYLEVK